MLLGLNLYMNYSKSKPKGYFQKWQLEILKNVWENNASYLIHELRVNPLEGDGWDNTYAHEEMLGIWNDFYERYSMMLPQFSDKAINKLLREEEKQTEKTKGKEEQINLPSTLLKKKITITDMG